MSTIDRIKARISPGIPVNFVYKNSQVGGRVVSLGRKCATVRSARGQQYRVPYRQLQVQGSTRDHSETENRALARCRDLLRQHGLDAVGWVASLDESRARAGACNFTKKMISLSRLYVRVADPAELDDTILHEIAHALVGPQHHHDAVWRAKARAIGCSGDRCHTLKFSPPRWIAACAAGCFTRPVQRRRRNVVCRRCGGPVSWRAWDGVPDPEDLPRDGSQRVPAARQPDNRGAAAPVQGVLDFTAR